jgi:hypothetical protein
LTTATNSLASGDFAILTVVSDNTATADGNTNTHTGVSGGTGTWTKLGEYTNTVGGVAADGVCTSQWLFEATGTVAVGTVITITLSAARVDKCASMWKFTKAAGWGIRLDPDATTNPVTNGTDAANGFGSAAFSGLPSQARLYIRALGKEANSTTDITVSTNFTALTLTRSRNNASAVLLRGEFRINTSTGETSNPTLAVVGDTAPVFSALEEFLPTRTGTLAATETGADTFSSTGKVIVQGSLAATESGSDTFASTGKVIVQGSLAVSETGSDTFAASGTVTDNLGVTGSMAATETGSDAFASSGKVLVKGGLVATEAGVDTFAATGKVLVKGSLAATETGSDSFASTGKVIIKGSLAASESGADTFASTGKILVQGILAATEVGLDTFVGTSSPVSTGTMAATEVGSDGFTGSGTALVVVSGGGGGTLVRFSSPGSAYINSYKSQIRRARKKVQAAQRDPLLAEADAFKQALNEAYLALQQLALLVTAQERLRIEKEAEELRKAQAELELKAAALRAKQALEDEEDELLAANLW